MSATKEAKALLLLKLVLFTRISHFLATYRNLQPVRNFGKFKLAMVTMDSIKDRQSKEQI